MKLWMMRHAPVLAETGLCYGRTDFDADPAATEAAAQAICVLLPEGLVLRCSPRARCVQMAQALLARRPDLQFVTDERIAEMDFGTWEGLRWDSIGREAMDAWAADFADARPGGHGESVREFMTRVGEAFDEWRASPAETLWVAHAGVARAVQLWQRGVSCPSSAADWPMEPAFPPGGWLTVSAHASA